MVWYLDKRSFNPFGLLFTPYLGNDEAVLYFIPDA
jgi:hypothetical protein